MQTDKRLIEKYLEDRLPGGWILQKTPGVYVSVRDSMWLVVEPESASWLVLDEFQWNVYRRMHGSDSVDTVHNPSVVTIDDPRPVNLDKVSYEDIMTQEQFNRFLLLLFHHNMVTINGVSYFEPSRMWNVQKYPHYFNLHMTEACNLGCKYCRIDVPGDVKKMSSGVARKIVKRVIGELPVDHVIIGFHGGEPLLNLSAIVSAAEEARALAETTGKKIDLMVQTNGTLLSPEVATILRRNEIQVGVSIDGTQPIHDRNRTYRDGKSTYDDVKNGIQCLRGQGVPVGYLSVVHDPREYKEICDHIVRSFETPSLRLNFSSYEGRAMASLDFPVDRAALFAREWLGLVDYAEEYHERHGSWLDISDVNLFVFQIITKDRPHMCYRSPCGVGNSIVGFDPDGELYLCDELVGDPAFRIGRIDDPANLADLLDGSEIKATMMEQRKVEKISKCSRCAWRRFHGSGCANKSYRYFGATDKEDPMCRFYSIIFEELMWKIWGNPDLVHLSGYYGSQVNLGDIVDTIKNIRQRSVS